MQLGVIADDFTGATDIASFLVRNGMPTVQLNGVPTRDLPLTSEAVVISLKTRSCPAQSAVSQSLAALRWLQAQGCQQFYFKYCSTFDSTAEGNIGPVLDALLAELSALDRVPLPRAENIAMPRREPVRRVEHFDTTQAKLCMLFTLGQPMQPEQLAAVRLAMALYGGSVTSRLFLNVRERDHLCYYCSSAFQSFTGSMAVNSGVEHTDAARAEQAVLKELADLCDGPITDEELEDCRRGLLAGMNGLEDTLGGIETWYYMEVLRGGPVQTPDDARRALLAVTREDVRDILKQFTLSVSCLLTREEGNENG